MKPKLSLTILLSLVFGLWSFSQVPQGFNYQAIARDAVSGNPITDPVDVRIAILAADASTVIREEQHSAVDPDDHGLFSLVIGQGSWVSGLSNFSDIDWTVTPKYIRTSVYYGGSWKIMAPAQLWSVPYAMVADSLGGPLKKLEVEGETEDMEESLFEVRNKDGHIVFAVYNEGVRIYVSDGDVKGPKGGFAIGGFGMVKQEDDHQYFFVSGDSIRAYIDSTSVKGPKGGFAIGGFEYTKGKSQDYMKVTRDSVRIYLDANPATKGPKGGFAIGGFDYTKGDQNFFNVSMDTLGKVDPSENRILWYPLKNAFRTGKVLIEKRDSVGENSFASGYESKAVGKYSQALGYKTIARGNYSTAIGYECVAHAVNATSIGWQSNANGASSMAIGTWATTYQPYSLAIGMGAIASGMYSTSLGAWANSSNDNSVAIGAFSVASADFSMAIGNSATASGDNSYSFGSNTNSTGLLSTSMGLNTTSQSYASMVFGRYNIIAGNLTTWVATDPLFVVGNGSSSTSRSNALTILKNGQIGLQTVTAPTFALELPNSTIQGIGKARANEWATYSDGRAKSSQADLLYGLKEIMSLVPKSYFHHTMIKSPHDIEIGNEGSYDIGLIAQEVYDIIPEAVFKPDNENTDLWSISYDKIIPVLINSIQEQQAQIESQNQENQSLKSELESLKERMALLESILGMN